MKSITMTQVQNDFNKLVSAFKFANPDSTHLAAIKEAKSYYDGVKNDPHSKAKIQTKCAEWKRKGTNKRAK